MSEVEAKGHLLVAGASGVIGAAAVELFGSTPGWTVTALSRRRPFVSPSAHFTHAGADLRDEADCARLAGSLPPVTHLIYAAVSEAPGLAAGWVDEALMETNGQMLRNLLGPLANSGSLRHVSILQGGKAYGAHLHPVTVPLRESEPRDPHANFYWLHEDFTLEQAARHGFSFTIWRPQILLGGAPGAAMNPVAAIGAYAAICRERGLPFVLPGESESLWQMVDADLLARAFAWAARSPQAADETFNITNGDLFVLRHAWTELAHRLALDCAGPAPASLAEFFAQAENRESWMRLATRHALGVEGLDDLLGESHHYLDLLTSPRIAAKQSPMIVSTIKIRQAGFGDCRDSLESLLAQLARMVDLGLLPPDCRPA